MNITIMTKGKRMNKQFKNGLTLTLLTTMTLVTSGCSPQAMQIAQAVAGNTIGASSRPATMQDKLTQTLTKTNVPSKKGFLQGQAIGAKMLSNPAMLGVGALGSIQDQRNKAANKAAFGKLSSMMSNPDAVNNTMENRMLQAVNQQNGTHFGTMQELQDSYKVSGYNEEEGTHFTTLRQVRLDHNKKKGTTFLTDKAFRDWIAEDR